MLPEPETPSMTPRILAELFIAGRSVRRSELVEMVRELLAVIDSRPSPQRATHPAAAPTNVKPPVKISRGAGGSIFLGPEANRFYTPSEAMALSAAIARAAAKP